MQPDFSALMRILSTPRPNGSSSERRTAAALRAWLEERQLPYRVHTFRQYPYFFEFIGVWLIVSRAFLAAAVWLRWGWPAALIAAIGTLGGLVDLVWGIPLVTWAGARQGQNLVIEIAPQNPERELVLTAHYDSKTEILDHHQRMFFLRSLPAGIAMTLLLGLLGPLDRWLWLADSPLAPFTYSLGIIMSIALLFLALGLGLNLSTGRLLPPSQGAVDNGAACAILLALAERLQAAGRSSASDRLKAALDRVQITLVLFTGEEVSMQGSRAYLKSRDWPLPVQALNLEVMAQDGPYVYWEMDGNALHLEPASVEVNRRIAAAVANVTGSPARPAGPLNSDGGSFLFAGIPASTVGTSHSRLGEAGFHSPADNLERVVMDRLVEGVDILVEFIQLSLDSGQDPP